MSLRFKSVRYVVIGMLFVLTHQMQAQKGVGTPPQSAERPLPVQNYAVIDLGLAGGYDSYGSTGVIALDDSGNATFGNFQFQSEGTFVRTFINGVVGPAVTYAHDLGSGEGVGFERLLPSGEVIGGHSYPTDSHLGPGRRRGCFFIAGTGPIDLNPPPPYVNDDEGFYQFTNSYRDALYIDSVSPNGGSVCYSFSYDGITRPDGSIYRLKDADGHDDYSSVGAITRGGVSYFFAPNTPSFLVDSATAKYIRGNGRPTRITDTGWAVMDRGAGISFGIWDGKQIVLDGLADAGQIPDLNNEGWCLELVMN